jgi:hypothetical protein
VLVAEAVDRRSLDVFHDEIGTPVRQCAPVEQPRDARVLERGQNLALFVKATRQVVSGSEPTPNELERDALRNAPSSRSAT